MTLTASIKGCRGGHTVSNLGCQYYSQVCYGKIAKKTTQLEKQSSSNDDVTNQRLAGSWRFPYQSPWFAMCFRNYLRGLNPPALSGSLPGSVRPDGSRFSERPADSRSHSSHLTGIPGFAWERVTVTDQLVAVSLNSSLILKAFQPSLSVMLKLLLLMVPGSESHQHSPSQSSQ